MAILRYVWGVILLVIAVVGMSMTAHALSQQASQTTLLNAQQAISQQQRQPLSIAVAANFAGPLNTLLPDFEAATGIQTRVTIGSSGALYAQIQHGAPFDVFLSADTMRPQALVQSGKVPADAVTTYTIGQLAVVGNVSGVTDPLILSEGLRVAIADPGLAPYGRAAQELLVASGVWKEVQPQLIRGANVQQTLQFWQTGNVDVALIAASQCVTYQLDCQSVPDDYAPVVQQMAIITQRDAQAAAAKLFADYLQSTMVQQQLATMGYQAVTDITHQESL